MKVKGGKMNDRLKKCMEYAQKCFKERVSVSDNDFIGGRGLHYIRLENNQAVVVDRDKNVVVKLWFNDDGSVKKLKTLEE